MGNREQVTIINEGLADDSLTLRIVYCDSGCVVVNKIAGEAVEGAPPLVATPSKMAGMADLPRLLAVELAAFPQALPADDALELPVAAHRLDVPVSGCVVFARTSAALRFLNEAFRNNAVEKSYWAIVEPPKNDKQFLAFPESGEAVHWIQFDSRRNKSIAFDEQGPGRKKAVLKYRLAGRGRDYLFFEIKTETGRHHQIRAQLQRLGLHIKGDLKYGAKRSEKNGGIRLHARSLSFPNPAGSGRISVQADPPLRDNLWKAYKEHS